jgi:predicted alpha/beta hydrolase
MLPLPAVSLADYLASKGWDVWTCELRGNGLSDKPQLFSARGTQWTIDDYVEKDVPAIIRFVLKESKAQQVHFLGHSMVGGCGCAYVHEHCSCAQCAA